MTSLADIEAFLNIEIGDKRLKDGKKRSNKNRYYFYENQYYIVQLTQGKYMICEDCKTTRRLLRLNCWRYGTKDSYGRTSFKNGTKDWHQLYLNYKKERVADHLNNRRFDNRHENLRVTTPRENNRNRSKNATNTSGKQGVHKWTQKKTNCTYWRSRIVNDIGKRVMKCFSIQKSGYDEAKRLAIEWRIQKEQEFGYIGD
jgi:hypothetical protein